MPVIPVSRAPETMGTHHDRCCAGLTVRNPSRHPFQQNRSGLVLRDPRGRVDRPRRRIAATAGGRAGTRADAQAIWLNMRTRPLPVARPAVARGGPHHWPAPGRPVLDRRAGAAGQMFGFPTAEPFVPAALAGRWRRGSDQAETLTIASLPGTPGHVVFYSRVRPAACLCKRRAVCRKHPAPTSPRQTTGS